jgi:hypothetical protein
LYKFLSAYSYKEEIMNEQHATPQSQVKSKQIWKQRIAQKPNPTKPLQRVQRTKRGHITMQTEREQTECEQCYELFRRAIVAGEEQAWNLIYQCYLPQVCKWVQRTAGFAASGEEADFFANRALQKFWTAFSAEKFTASPDLAAILQYLKLCAHSVVIDAMRAPKTLGLDYAGLTKPSFEGEWLVMEERQRFWALLLRIIEDEREQLLLHHRYVLGRRPQQIAADLPTHFADVDEVYRLLQSILGRLRRDKRIRTFGENE